MKKLILILLFTFNFAFSQVLITTKGSNVFKPDPSAVLHIEGSNKGLLMPRVKLNNSTDNSTVPTPVNGLILFNKKEERFNFWDNNKWNKNFEIEDAINVIKITSNFLGQSSGSTAISTFPTSMPLYSLESNTTGWTDLGSSTTINITKANNSSLITVEGMAQLDNVNDSNREFQFAIGVFVDGKLKVVRKFHKLGQATCIWKKFNLSGVFDNLSVGTHTVSVYATNLPKTGTNTSGYTKITYGGASGNCNNLNTDMARIFVSVQVTQ